MLCGKVHSPTFAKCGLLGTGRLFDYTGLEIGGTCTIIIGYQYIAPQAGDILFIHPPGDGYMKKG
jgi:hypothetical protein